MNTEYEIKQLKTELSKVQDPIVQKLLERILEILEDTARIASNLEARSWA